ncbi:hypothetical protein [Fischerella thermalis]|uniref:hypothetical protein n=1 Tax=Fischerella thermalis TaxID=372787 RepID=UPI00031597BD|nr:hypothetical protein [Fischerella thermalis]PLZ79459.1 hypothetical protein CBP14_01100 [Fischerella thermalis WC245]
MQPAIALHTDLDYQQNTVTLRNSRQQPSDRGGGLAHSESNTSVLSPTLTTPPIPEKFPAIPPNSSQTLLPLRPLRSLRFITPNLTFHLQL